MNLIPGLIKAKSAISKLNLDLHSANELFSRCGVTRLAEVTGLDHIGVPVWSCARPKSRSFSVSFGKGINDTQAQISALMEAAENSFAENRNNLVCLKASINAVKLDNTKTVDLTKLSRCRYSLLDEKVPIDWVRGVTLGTNEEIFAPFDLIGLDYFQSELPHEKGFNISTIGLGAGLNRDHAVTHALLELIEHDSVALLEMLPVLAENLPPIAFPMNTSSKFNDILARFHKANIKPVFRIISEEMGCPVVMCSVPRFLDEKQDLGKVCAGFASRSCIIEAALASLLEAAQMRLTLITGTREDLNWSHYKSEPHFELSSFNAKPISVKPKKEIDLTELKKRLKKVGLNEISIFVLTKLNDPICIVRVLAEGLDIMDPEHNVDFGAGAINLLVKMSRKLA